MFECTLSHKHQAMTRVFNIAIPATLLVAGAALLVAALNAEEFGVKVGLLVALVSMVPSAVTLSLLARNAPGGYLVEPDGISLVRRSGKKELILPTYEIQSVEALDPEKLRRAIRTCGVGGYHGSWGRFRSPALGKFRAYMTNDFYVLVQSAKGPYVLTPDAREEFIAAANQTFNLPRANTHS